MATNEIKTIIILRNDSTTAWESSDWVLKSGEIGVGYMTVTDEETQAAKQVPIIKVGDGVNVWKNLPQAEGVFENDVILTYNFGKHTTSNGFVNAGGKGMTTSEWLIDALSVTEEPSITQPTASMSASFTPSSGETGTAITKLNWNGSFTDGKYEYGSTQNKTANSNANASVSWVVKNGETQIGTTEDGNINYSGYLTDSNLTLTLSSTATINVDNVYTPLNNVGAETTGAITGFDVNGTKTKSFAPTASVRGYRKMFVGTTSAATLDSATIRGLNLKSAQASTTAFEVTAPIGATKLVVACPTNSQGKKYTLSKAEMFTMSYEDYTAKFVQQASVNVADARGGENGLQVYNVYVYEFEALKAATKFKFTLASVNA